MRLHLHGPRLKEVVQNAACRANILSSKIYMPPKVPFWIQLPPAPAILMGLANAQVKSEHIKSPTKT